MTRRVAVLTVSLLLAATACSSKASSGPSAGDVTTIDTTTTLVTDTTTTAGAATTSVAGDSTTTAAPLYTTAPTPAPTSAAPPTPAPTVAPTAPPTTAPCRVVNINDTMRRGDCGDAVTFLQERLTVLGFSVSADGQFGPGTERVVKDFQTSRGLTADGIVGAETWAALVEGGIGD